MQKVFLVQERALDWSQGFRDLPSATKERRRKGVDELGYALNVAARELAMDAALPTSQNTSQVRFLVGPGQDALQTAYLLASYAPKVVGFESFPAWAKGAGLAREHALGRNGTLVAIGAPERLEGIAGELFRHYFAGESLLERKAPRFYFPEGVVDYLFDIPKQASTLLQRDDALLVPSFKPEYLALQRGPVYYKHYKELQGAFAVRQLKDFERDVLGLPSTK
jgi:hypothetical protein